MSIIAVLNSKAFNILLSLVCYIGLSLALAVVFGHPGIFIIGFITTVLGVLWWYATDSPTNNTPSVQNTYVEKQLAFINKYANVVTPESFLGVVITQANLDIELEKNGIINQDELIYRSNFYVRIFNCYDQVNHDLSKGIKRLLLNQTLDDYLRTLFGSHFNSFLIHNP